MAQLSLATLKEVAKGVSTPKYDRSELKTGIVHFGVGGFHRAHMAMTIDRLLNDGLAKDWAICGVGLLEFDRKMRDVFAEQDCLYTLTLKHPDGRRETSVIGSIIEYIFAPDSPALLIEKLAHPDTKIVSLTITEGGYNFDRVTGEFMAQTPAVAADLQPGASPTTAFGYITEGLRLRRERGIAPFTVQSCDNIQGNGEVAKKMFVAFAKLKDEELGAWIEDSVHFPNSMVDRITPVTASEDIVEVEQITGLADKWPVVAEPFFQWVIDDEFNLGRPPYEKADVQMVKDVMPYELMKLRLLNASHQGLTYFGYLSGYRYAHEATTDPSIANFLLKYMENEATPTLLPVPGVDLDDYRKTLIARFSNPEVKDTLARLCAESSDRIPKWLVPVIHERLAQGGDVTLSAAIVASWARYAEAVDEQGEPINVVDPLKEELIPIAKSQRVRPLAFVENRQLFGNLVDNEKFTKPYLAALNSLFENGAHATVEALSR
jgi:mannitol 2-dehydrogenase